MTINENIFELISEMEYIVGNQTLSKSTFIGAGLSDYDGYRYPVRISLDGNQEESKTQIRDKVHTYQQVWRAYDDTTKEMKVIKTINTTPDMIGTMYYAFGSHLLYIGDALIKILEFLEKRYGKKFNQTVKFVLRCYCSAKKI